VRFHDTVGADGYVGGLASPIGLDYQPAWLSGDSTRLSFGLTLLDPLGAAQLDKSKTIPDAKLVSIIDAGVHATLGMGNSPLVLRAAIDYKPGLQSEANCGQQPCYRGGLLFDRTGDRRTDHGAAMTWVVRRLCGLIFAAACSNSQPAPPSGGSPTAPGAGAGTPAAHPLRAIGGAIPLDLRGDRSLRGELRKQACGQRPQVLRSADIRLHRRCELPPSRQSVDRVRCTDPQWNSRRRRQALCSEHQRAALPLGP
jgi:hypothetical protein